MIAHHWNLPKPYTEVIAYHHDLNATSGQNLLCLIVNVADVMAYALELAGPDLARVPTVDPSVWNALGLDLDEIDLVVEDALFAFEENKKSFALFNQEEILT
jgi:HD-like signal output (HDOD) protein